MNKNEFEHDGKVYVAVKSGYGCDGYQLFSSPNCIDIGEEMPSCIGENRSDGEFVIFLEKQQ